MKEKESGKIVLNLFIILIVLIAIVEGVLLYRTNKNNKSEDVVSKIASTEEEQKQELDVESELIQTLNRKLVKYNKLGAMVYSKNNQTNYFDSSFYKDAKIEYNDLSNEEKIVAVINNIIPREAFVNDIIDNNKLWNKEAFLKSSNRKLYTKEDINEEAKNIFGKNAEDIKWETLDMCGSVLDYVDGNYYEYNYDGGGLGYTNTAASKIIKAEKQGDYIYIYDKFLYCDETEYWVNNGKMKFYKSSTKKDELNDVKVIYSENNYEIVDKTLENNLDICSTYKHTFKVDNEGNCYWISSEPIE